MNLPSYSLISEQQRNEEEEQRGGPPHFTAYDQSASLKFGRVLEASPDLFQQGEQFCQSNPPYPALFLNDQQKEAIRTKKSGAWTFLAPGPFSGSIQTNPEKAITDISARTKDDLTLLTNLPIVFGNYANLSVSQEIYMQVTLGRVDSNASVCIGLVALPYPTAYRLPGWHRRSCALHSDDGNIFIENPNGGVPFSPALVTGDVVGMLVDENQVSYTLNGRIIGKAFDLAIFQPRNDTDIFAAIGVFGHVSCSVSFPDPFRRMENISLEHRT